MYSLQIHSNIPYLGSRVLVVLLNSPWILVNLTYMKLRFQTCVTMCRKYDRGRGPGGPPQSNIVLSWSLSLYRRYHKMPKICCKEQISPLWNKVLSYVLSYLNYISYLLFVPWMCGFQICVTMCSKYDQARGPVKYLNYIYFLCCARTQT